MTIRSGRCILRPWCEADRQPFRALGADARVMRYFPATLSPGESDALSDRFSCALSERGWGVWVLDVPGEAAFAGIVGLNVSKAVMRRLGMTPDGEFDHPLLPTGHWLRRHVLYRKKAS